MSVVTDFTILGGSFEELWPFFCQTEGPQDYPVVQDSLTVL